MEIKNRKKYKFSAPGFLLFELALTLAFISIGLAVKTAPTSAACSTSGNYYCSGSDVRQVTTRFGNCSSRYISSCQYGCTGAGYCNPAPCAPSCTGDQCGQANGCGGTCATTDSSSCGKCGNAACPVACSDNGSTCDYSDSCDTTGNNNCGTEVSRCNRTTSSSKNWSGWTDTTSCSASCGGGTKNQSRTCDGAVACGGTDNCTGISTQTVNCNTQACSCTVRSICTDSANLYTRAADCSTSNTACAYGCVTTGDTGACNSCTPANGACGGANKVYDDNASGFGADAICAAGAASPSSPSFPGVGGYTTWTCGGNACGTSPSCTAYRRVPTPSLSVTPASFSSGGTLAFSWGGVTGAAGYGIGFKRNGTWDSAWTWVGNVTSYNFSTSGLSGSVEGQVLAYSSSYVFSYNSNIVTATTCTGGSWTGACTAACGGGTNTCVRGSCSGAAGDCSGAAPACNTQACTCAARSLCTDSATLYTRNADCTTASTNCPDGCWNTACKVNGSCGGAVKNYVYADTSYSGSFCGNGTANPSSPAFPAAGGSTTWSCDGSNTGSNASCTATHTGAPVIGACGTADDSIYNSGDTAYSGTFCSSGTTATPSFPAIGGAVAWTCNGANGGGSPSCTAYRRVPAPVISVSPTNVGPGGTLAFSWPAVTNAVGYGIAFKRNGVWDANFTYGVTSPYNFSTTSLSGSVEGQAVAYSASVFGYASNIVTATIVPPPTADIKANNSNGPIDIGYNASATISWASSNTSNASDCTVTLSGSSTTWTGTFDPGRATGNLLVTRTYSLSCTGTGGTATDSVEVRVAVPTVSITSFTGAPASATTKAPLNGVDFAIKVGGNAVGDIRYQIDCTSNGSYEIDATTASNPYTAVDVCNYSAGGDQSVRAVVTRDSVVVNKSYTYNVLYPDAVADIQAQLGTNSATDGPLNVPVNSAITLSWSSIEATACSASGGWSGNRATAGTQSDTIGTASKTYNLTCTGPGVAGTDSVVANPIPLAPANLRVTSATPYVKGQTMSFSWNAAATATYYLVAFYPNGSWDGAYNRPSPQSSTSISYSNTSNISQLGISVTACNPNGCGNWANPPVYVALIDPTPLNLATGVTTTSGTLSGSLVNANDVRYVKISSIATDQLYRVNITSGNVTVTVVDASGNPINDGTTVLVQSVGRDIVVRVPAGSGNRYLKFSGSAGSYNYTLKRFRRFPYLEAL